MDSRPALRMILSRSALLPYTSFLQTTYTQMFTGKQQGIDTLHLRWFYGLTVRSHKLGQGSYFLLIIFPMPTMQITEKKILF